MNETEKLFEKNDDCKVIELDSDLKEINGESVENFLCNSISKLSEERKSDTKCLKRSADLLDDDVEENIYANFNNLANVQQNHVVSNFKDFSSESFWLKNNEEVEKSISETHFKVTEISNQIEEKLKLYNESLDFTSIFSKIKDKVNYDNAENSFFLNSNCISTNVMPSENIDNIQKPKFNISKIRNDFAESSGIFNGYLNTFNSEIAKDSIKHTFALNKPSETDQQKEDTNNDSTKIRLLNHDIAYQGNIENVVKEDIVSVSCQTEQNTNDKNISITGLSYSNLDNFTVKPNNCTDTIPESFTVKDSIYLNTDEEKRKNLENVNQEKSYIHSSEMLADSGISNESQSPIACSCERPVDVDDKFLLLNAWKELRLSIKQVHRFFNSKNVLSTSKSLERPSINRIKALSNMLFNQDPYQLFIRSHQLSQEFCIELKIKILSVICDLPDSNQASSFVSDLLGAYEIVMTACDFIQPAFDKLDSVYLNDFHISWKNSNVHVFYSTILADPDVQDYFSLCSDKINEESNNENTIAFNALQEIVNSAEIIWEKSENAIQEYALERAAYNAHNKRHAVAEWDPSPQALESYSQPMLGVNNGLYSDNRFGPVACTDCCNERNSYEKILQICDCIYCMNDAPRQCASATGVPNVGLNGVPNIDPISHHSHLDLYPHLKAFPNDAAQKENYPNFHQSSNMNKTEMAALKNLDTPIDESLIGSDILSKQLLREWETKHGEIHDQEPAVVSINCQTNLTENLTENIENLKISLNNLDNLNSVSTQNKFENISSNTNQEVSLFPPAHQKCQSLSHSESQQPMINNNKFYCNNRFPRPHLHPLAGPVQPIPLRSCSHPLPNSLHSSRISENKKASRDWSSEDSLSQCDCCYCRVIRTSKGAENLRPHRRKSKRHKGSDSQLPNERSQIDQSPENLELTSSRLQNSESKTDGTKINKSKKKKLARKRIEKKRMKRSSSTNESEDFESDTDQDNRDGPLAELRRRAPDVTITVVKPGQHEKLKQTKKNSPNLQKETIPNPEIDVKQSSPGETWQPRQPGTGSWNFPKPDDGWQPMQSSMVPELTKNELPEKPVNEDRPTGGLSSLLKNMESLKDKDGKNSSKMVTIRRVMDPVSSEPTVTITLKNEETKKDKLLFKLVNGQALRDGEKNKKEPKPKKKIEEKPVYIIPEGCTPEEAKRLRKQQKKERQKRRKEEEQNEIEEKEKLKHLELQKKRDALKQQEATLKKQQMALLRQQQDLVKQNKKNKSKSNNDNKNNNSQKNNNNQQKKNKGSNSKNEEPAIIYDRDDLARNYTLPPGVSINKVAGQPGMVNISSNMGSPFGQPFMYNPKMYPGQPTSGYSPMGQSSMDHGCGSGHPCGSGPPWTKNYEAPSKEESVIVVDTLPTASDKAAKNKDKNTKSNEKNTKKSTSNAEKSTKISNNDKNTKNSKGTKNNENVTKNADKNNKNAGKNSDITSKNAKKADKTAKNTDKNAKADKTGKNTKSINLETLTSDEIVDLAVKGKIEMSLLNQTQKKKVKKTFKAMQEEEEKKLEMKRLEEEKVLQAQREEDALMDQIYEISKFRPEKKGKQNNKIKNKQQENSNKSGENKDSKSSKTSKNVENLKNNDKCAKESEKLKKLDGNGSENSKKSSSKNTCKDSASNKSNKTSEITKSKVNKGKESKLNTVENLNNSKYLDTQNNAKKKLEKQPNFNSKNENMQEKSEPKNPRTNRQRQDENQTNQRVNKHQTETPNNQRTNKQHQDENQTNQCVNKHQTETQNNQRANKHQYENQTNQRVNKQTETPNNQRANKHQYENQTNQRVNKQTETPNNQRANKHQYENQTNQRVNKQTETPNNQRTNKQQNENVEKLNQKNQPVKQNELNYLSQNRPNRTPYSAKNPGNGASYRNDSRSAKQGSYHSSVSATQNFRDKTSNFGQNNFQNPNSQERNRNSKISRRPFRSQNTFQGRPQDFRNSATNPQSFQNSATNLQNYAANQQNYNNSTTNPQNYSNKSYNPQNVPHKTSQPQNFPVSGTHYPHSIINKTTNTSSTPLIESTIIGDASKMDFNPGGIQIPVGFASNTQGHETRYAQYLAANANSLGNVGPNSRGQDFQNNYNPGFSSGSHGFQSYPDQPSHGFKN